MLESVLVEATDLDDHAQRERTPYLSLGMEVNRQTMANDAVQEIEVPVHLFLSPEHSVYEKKLEVTKEIKSYQRHRRRIKETSFTATGKNGTSTEELLFDEDHNSSSCASPTAMSSETDDSHSPKRGADCRRKTNKISDIRINEQSFNKLSGIRRKSGGDFLKEADGRQCFTSMSDHVPDHLSGKDRLKEQVTVVKDKAGESVSRPHSRSQSRAPSRMRMLLHSRTQRAEDSLKREEREVAAALERHQKLRSQWHQLSQELLSGKTEKDGYEFFTREEVGLEDTNPMIKDSISPVLTTKSEDERITAADILNIASPPDPITWLPAKLAEDTSAQFKQLLFCPSSKSVPCHDKLEEGLNPRFIEEEGLYVEGKKNNQRSRNKLEHRLLNVPGGKKWFGLDGEFIGKPCRLEHDLEIHEKIIKGTEYRFPTLSSPRRDLENKLVVLDVELLNVRYLHHSLFSREHVLAQRLRDLWKVLRQLRQTDACRRIKGQLDALRRVREAAQDTELDRLNNQIQDVRKKWFAESFLEKQVQIRIQDTWRDLQRMREEQGFRNTSVSLVVKHKPGPSLEEWEADLQIEIAEAQREQTFIYEKLKLKYNKELAIWKEKLAQLEEASDIADESAIAEQPPIPIPHVDLEAVAQETRTKFQDSFRNPNEPHLEFTLLDLGPPTASDDSKEEARRTAVRKQEVSVTLLCNGKEVYRSESEPLSALFSVRFGQRFAVRLLDWPKQLCLQIQETGRDHSNVYLPFPARLMSVERSEVEHVEFSSAAVVTHAHTGVGCGRELIPCPGGSAHNARPVCLYSSGVVSYRVGWAVDGAGDTLAPPCQFWIKDKGDVSSRKIHTDLAKLKEWVEKVELDPNDPQNAKLLNDLAQKMPVCETVSEEELNFCDDDIILNNPRLRLLRLRDRGEPEFRGYQMVPLCEKLIHPDIFKAYEARVAKPVEPEAVVEHLDSHRVVGRRKIEQIRQFILQKCRQARQHRRHSDVIIEEQVPDLSTLGLTLMKWLKPKRPLRPERKQRKKLPVQNLLGQDINIIVNVVRAFEVPVRKDMDSLAPRENVEGLNLVNVRPYVTVSFRGVTARTTAADGANPTWNQDLTLPVRNSTGDFSPGVLAGIKDVLYLHLFDEVIIDLVEEEGLRETTIHQRLEKHWLASLEIPFSTLYCNSRMEGTFQLYSPPVLLGYEREAHKGIGMIPQRDATYLTLFITVQPALNPPEPHLDIFSTSEPPIIEKHLRGWQTEMKSLFPGRRVNPLVSTGTGTAVCVTRFIRPIPPPVLPDMEDGITTAAAARFVSKIPTMSSATFYPGLLHVWLTCDQTVEMLLGNIEDHAVLLCCMLLHMGLPAYLLLGIGIPHGASAYVLINSPGAEVLWEPTTGTRYSLRDSFCPLQKVFCILNNTNIWGNIQDDDSPRRTRFDVSKRTDWLPAFNKNVAAPSDSIQPEAIPYKVTSRQAVHVLQEKLENRLREGMMKWRPRHRTQWNRYCAATMRKLLPQLEAATWHLDNPSSIDHWKGLEQILASYKVCGFSINMAYTDVNAVMEAVKATGAHSIESEDVEFAVAVHIHAYPSDVLSVWIYAASLIRRR